MNNIDTVQHIELSEIESNPQETVAMSQRDYQLVKSVPIEVDVEIGTLDMTLEKLFSLKVGEILEMDKEVDKPIYLVVDGKKIAEGNLVAVNGVFGIEISDILK
jgi:flagellar motor switch protein FliN/FliY